MTKKTTLTLLAVMGILSGLLLLRGNTKVASQQPSATGSVAPQNESSPVLNTTSESPGDSSITPPSKKLKTIEQRVKQFPKNITQDYRRSIQKDSHQTPEIVIQSALHLGGIFDQVKNQDDATTAFDFFAKCVSEEEVPAVQTTCFRYAERLAKKFTSLSESFSTLEKSTSKDILRIVRFGQTPPTH